MPLVIALLLADADPEFISSCHAATGRHAAALAGQLHLLTGQGVYEELKKQLDDTQSPLRTAGSAFGILAAMGTSLRLSGNTRIHASDLPDQILPCHMQEAMAADMGHEPSAPLCRRLEQNPKVPKTLDRCGTITNPAGPVPPIASFPGSWTNASNAWWASCVPESCRSGCSQQRVKAVVMVESRCSPQLKGSCEPAQLCRVSPKDLAAVYEAGSGGWPLCVPHAFAAFRPAQAKVERKADTVKDIITGGETEPDIQAPVATACFLKREDFKQTRFHHVSLEADDDEVTLLLGASKISEKLTLPSWLQSMRVVVSRSNIFSARHWSAAEVVRSWPSDLQGNGGPLYRNWVEIVCTPRNAPDPLSLLLALPSTDIARRFHQVFSETPRPPKPLPPSRDSQRAAVTCELQLLAKVDVSQEMQVLNCGMSVCRSICEATGIQRNRVQVLNVSEGGGSLLGWAAVHWNGLQNALNAPSAPERHSRQLDV